MQKQEIRRQVVLGILSVIYAICLVFGHDIMLNYEDGVQYTSLSVWMRVVSWIVILFFALNIARIAVTRIWRGGVKSRVSACRFTISDRKFYWVTVGLILVSYMPTYLACYPGLGIYDGPCQLGQLTTHHPLLHTLLIRFCEKSARWLHWESWLVPYSLIQMCVLACCLSYAVLCLKRWAFSGIYISIMIAWICLFPMNALMSITSTKDTLFAALFLLLICELGKMMYSPEDYFNGDRKKYHSIQYCVICFLVCAFRNNGVYVLIGMLPVMAVCVKRYWKKIATLSLIVIAGYFVYSGPLMNVLGIPQGDKKEALTVIIQPMARTYHWQYEALQEEDREAIRQLFGGVDPWYEAHISDAPKSQFHTEVFLDHLWLYLRLYGKLGIQFPKEYADALLANTYGNWYPHEILPDDTCYRFYFEFPGLSPEEYGSKLPGYYTFLQKLSRESSYLNVPFLYLFFCTGIVFWIVSFLIGVIVIRKEYRKMIYFAPAIFLFITIMLGPVALMRYTYPLMVSVPVLTGYTFSKELIVYR